MMETHPFAPFIPEKAKLLMVGSFPPPKARWGMDFFYPNPQNDMWRIYGLAFFDDKNHFLNADSSGGDAAKIRAFLSEKGIAIAGVAYKVERLKGNASDQFLRIVETVDLSALLAKVPHCHSIMTTGGKATDTLCELLPENTRKPTLQKPGQTQVNNRKLNLYRLPSTSRAYPKPLAEKAAIYAKFFREVGVLSG
ncbi:uracil-DNA glycosylase family protein [Suttonella sp. R2A3]|uniref:uracil-DNA glycosylase family protein n=1 Tax=Suttonella sp. R2A3 TaxID=2908648 RepID=UPI001F2AE5C2|nr:uracil-DNA glycosylase family protein [Suttonella sp. R2A3]UJF25349.1 uracil-DNA glycosylase family protein [Suttonella sp. R2A3]